MSWHIRIAGCKDVADFKVVPPTIPWNPGSENAPYALGLRSELAQAVVMFSR